MSFPSRFLFVALALACLSGVALSETYYVDVDAPSPQNTIQWGLDSASHGDTVLVGPGVYTGAGNRDLVLTGTDVHLLAEESWETTVIDCEGSGRGIRVWWAVRPVIDGFTVRNGSSCPGAGAWIESGGEQAISNCRFEHNETITGGANYGGALYLHACGGTPSIRNCSFAFNTSDTWGAGLLVRGNCSPVVEDCFVTSNDGYGGVAAIWSATPSFVNCVITRNTGGGVFLVDACASFSNCSITWNRGNGVGSDPGTTGTPLCSMSNTVVAFNEGFGFECLWPLLESAEYCCFYNEVADTLTLGGCLDGAVSDCVFTTDPLFCGMYGSSLCEDSFCLPDNNPWSEHIGAEPQGCGPCGSTGTPELTGERSWGAVKALFR